MGLGSRKNRNRESKAKLWIFPGSIVAVNNRNGGKVCEHERKGGSMLIGMIQ